MDGTFIAISKVDTEEQLVYGAVLIPETFDAQGHIISKEVIQKAAHEFMENINSTVDMGVMHDDFEPEIVPVESTIVAAEFMSGEQTITEGTWFLVSKVKDDDAWERVKNGELRGYSMAGTGKSISAEDETGDEVLAKSISGSEKTKKRLIEVHADEVSLVDNPAIEVEFSIMKRKTPVEIEKKGAKISAARLAKIQSAYETLEAILNEMDTDEEPEIEETDMDLEKKVTELEAKIAEQKELLEKANKDNEELVSKQKAEQKVEEEATVAAETDIKKRAEATEAAIVTASEKIATLEKSVEKADADGVATWAELKKFGESLDSLNANIDKITKSIEDISAKPIEASGATGSEDLNKQADGEVSFGNIINP